MSEEEKYEKIVLDIVSNYVGKGDYHELSDSQLEIILNLISKLQQENEELKAKYDKALTDLVNEGNKIITLNKIIHKMSLYIASCDTDEDICKKMYPNNSCEGNGIPCWDCIKEYFLKEVENDGNK